ncbi:MAG TPA: RDD family protein [Polyangia bacterium]
MDASGKLTLETPEQIGIEYELAGVGSRLLAALLDLLYMLVFLIAAVIAVIASLSSEERVARRVSENLARSEVPTAGLSATAAILLLLSVFLVQWGYYIISEMVTKGASPGKRALGLRVIRDNGLPIGFSQSLLRNLVRLVDFLPWGYGLGLIAVFVSSRSQRLGDLVAGTLVVRVDKSKSGAPGVFSATPTQDRGPRWLTPDERQLVERYFERRPNLLPEARIQVSNAIATPLRKRLAARAELPSTLTSIGDDDAWLERLLLLETARPVDAGGAS